MHSILASQALENLQPPPQLSQVAKPGKDPLAHATEVKAAFTDFFGKTFYSQLVKALRSAEQKPAYFHGGQAEEIFRSRLDQTLVDEMSKATAESFSEPMFRHQFPRLAEQFDAAKEVQKKPFLDQIAAAFGSPQEADRGLSTPATSQDQLRQLNALRRR